MVRSNATRVSDAVSYARRHWHMTALVNLRILATQPIRVAALRATLTRVPGVLLEVEWLGRPRKRLRIQSGASRGGPSHQCARPSICSVGGSFPFANAPQFPRRKFIWVSERIDALMKTAPALLGAVQLPLLQGCAL